MDSTISSTSLWWTAGVAMSLGACSPTPARVPSSTGTASDSSTIPETSSSSESGSSSEASSTGLVGCTEVFEGDLRVDEDTDLDWLRTVREVTGTLRVEGTTTWTTLEPLSCLQKVGQSLSIRDNMALESLDGLERLEVLGAADILAMANFAVSNNPSLKSLRGMDSLRKIESIFIQSNASLDRLELNHVEEVQSVHLGGCDYNESGDDFYPFGDNPQLIEFDGFDALLPGERALFTSQGQSNMASLSRLVELTQAGVDVSTGSMMFNPKLGDDEIAAVYEAAGYTPPGAVEDRFCENRDNDLECRCFDPFGMGD